MKTALVFLPDRINAEPFTDSLIIADHTNTTHHATQTMISKYEKDLSEFGTLSFEMRACPHKTGSSFEKIYRLNEQQATLLISYMKNTEPVRKFKKALVKDFFVMRKELTERKINRSMLKKTHKDLAEAVKLIPPHNNSAYDFTKYHTLAYMVAFGCSPSKLKKQRNAPSKAIAADYLTALELELIDNIKDKICTCLEMGMEYAEIKDKLMQMQIRNLSSKECN